MGDPGGAAAYSIQGVAERANLSEGFVRRLIAVGALPGEEAGLGPREVRRARLLQSWEAAGLSVEAIVTLVDRGALSLAFLDTPSMKTPERLERSYEELAAKLGVSLSLVQALHEALGFVPPAPGDRAGQDDVTLLDLAGLLREAGAADEPTLRLFSVYADSLRRIAKAEVEYYEANIEGRLRAGGLDERQQIEFSTRLGDRITSSRERALLMIYQRHREHVWTDHAIGHVEAALEGAGLQERMPQPPAICFVDLTGYTRLTEESGDEVAAQVSGTLASLVKRVSRDRGGRPIRWLGDGGMFHFREPWAAVIAGLDMVERAPAIGLPPAHVGIHTGPVISQDGDVYGKTVNLAARIASHAQAGQVVVSEETVRRSSDGPAGGNSLRFEALGAVELKGVKRPVPLFQAVRSA
jgi:adenylate cyclase